MHLWGVLIIALSYLELMAVKRRRNTQDIALTKPPELFKVFPLVGQASGGGGGAGSVKVATPSGITGGGANTFKI
jgi:hypothetical protein